MTAAPAFSVVIPTRNRAVLLRHALRTALEQTFSDLEVVVCDNASGDGTADAVAEIDDGRVRYVRTDRVLPAHENWEFALDHARGEWVTVLPDDDGLVPSLIERATPWLDDGGPRALAWRECTYTHPEMPAPWLEPDEANRLVVDPWTGRVDEINARAELRAIFERRERGPAPGLVGSLVHRTALDRLRDTAGTVFAAPDPFLRASAAFLALEPSYLILDAPLTVRGICGATISFGLLRNDAGHELVRRFVADDPFTEVPLTTPTASNVIAESLLRAKRELPESFDGIEWDAVAYFVTCRAEIGDARRRDDGGAAAAEWRRALALQLPAVRRAVRAALARTSFAGAARRLARRAVPSRLRRGINTRLGDPGLPLIIAGDEAGFADLQGAARHLDTEVLGAPRPAPATALP